MTSINDFRGYDYKLEELSECVMTEADHEIPLTAADLMLHILYTLRHHVTNECSWNSQLELSLSLKDK